MKKYKDSCFLINKDNYPRKKIKDIFKKHILILSKKTFKIRLKYVKK